MRTTAHHRLEASDARARRWVRHHHHSGVCFDSTLLVADVAQGIQQLTSESHFECSSVGVVLTASTDEVSEHLREK